MTQLSALKPRKLIQILKKLGFEKIRQEGSHIFFKHSDGRTTVVPNHPGKDIGRGLMRVIIDEIKLTPSEFQKLV